ncbi:unnamed protein product, partial [Ixodes persulcatus]
LRTLPADPSGQLDVLGHDGHALGVDGAQVGVLKQTHQICTMTPHLQCTNGSTLETEVRLEVLSNLTDESLKGQFADEQFRRFLVTTDFTEGHSTGPVTMWLLHSARGRGALARGLGGQLLARRLASGRLTGGLLGTGH